MLERQVQILLTEIGMLIHEHPEMSEDEILRADMLEAETDIDEVLTDLVRLIEDTRALKDGTSERLEDLNARKKRFEARIEFARNLIVKLMDAGGMKKRELPEATLSLRSPQPRVLGEVDANFLPDDLCRIRREPDKAKIRDALEQGREVPGCVLGNSPTTLNMRVK